MAGCAGTGSARAPGILEGLERRVLANGMAVVVKEDRRLPRVTAMLAYRVGSVNEGPGITGASHFFEHMVFKGTQKYKRGDIDLVTYRCGGENNAHTTNDMTGYWFSVGSRHLDEVFDILADTMGNCTLDAKEMDLERNTVLQEMNIDLDGPWGVLERDLEKTIYTKAGYRHPVLGWREDVEALTPAKMMAYYKAWYRPNRASLVVVGDVPKEEVFRKAEQFFGRIPRGPEAPAIGEFEPPQKSERTLEVKDERGTDRLVVAFRAEPAGTDTDIVLDVVSTILGDGRTSRLSARLIEKEDLAGEGNVVVFNYSRRHEGLFSVQVELALDAPLTKTREVVVEELEALKEKPVTERELRRAKNILRARFAFEAETQYNLVDKIGYFEALGLPDYVARYMDRVEAVTPEMVAAVSRKVFTAENRTVGIARAKAKRAPVPHEPRKRPGLRPWNPQGAPSLGLVQETVLENGLTVLVKPRHDLPVVAIHAFVDAGPLHEPAFKAGLARLTGELLDEGVDDGAGRTRTGDELAAEIEFVGGQFSADSNGAAAKVLAEHAPIAFDAVRDVLRFPSFPAARLDKVREDLLAEIETMDDDPQSRARRLFMERAYRGHPYERPPVGFAETVRKLTRDDVLAHYRRHFRPENVILAVSGDIDPLRALVEIRARFGTWKGEGPWKPLQPPPAKRQEEPRRASSLAKGMNQARIHVGHVGVERANPDYPVLRVMETILGSGPGFTSRLAKNVRDIQGLAYDVTGTITAGAGAAPGPFQVVLGVEPKDRDRGIEAVMKELRGFLDEGPTAGEVEDARRYLLASYVTAWETNESVAAYLVEVRRFGLGADYAEKFHKAVSAVTPEEVRRVARKHIDLKNLTTVVVGPDEKDSEVPKEGEKRK